MLIRFFTCVYVTAAVPIPAIPVRALTPAGTTPLHQTLRQYQEPGTTRICRLLDTYDLPNEPFAIALISFDKLIRLSNLYFYAP